MGRMCTKHMGLARRRTCIPPAPAASRLRTAPLSTRAHPAAGSCPAACTDAQPEPCPSHSMTAPAALTPPTSTRAAAAVAMPAAAAAAAATDPRICGHGRCCWCWRHFASPAPHRASWPGSRPVRGAQRCCRTAAVPSGPGARAGAWRLCGPGREGARRSRCSEAHRCSKTQQV